MGVFFLLFVLSYSVPVSIVCLFLCLMVVLFLNKSGNFSMSCLFSEWLSSSNRMFPIVNLNFFSQSIPSSGVMSIRSVINICISCLLFSYSISTDIFTQSFTSFLFTSWCRCFIFWISVAFGIFLSTG